MNIREAREALQAAWEARPFDYKAVAQAMAVLLELCDYDLERFAFRGGPYLIVNNTERRSES